MFLSGLVLCKMHHDDQLRDAMGSEITVLKRVLGLFSLFFILGVTMNVFAASRKYIDMKKENIA